MIGKTQWFSRRKYGGWGLTPKTWQGWVYVALFVAALSLTSLWPEGSMALKGVIILVLLADVIHMMMTLPKDERDRLHEAVADRNALWVMLAVLCGGIVYKAWPTATSVPEVDPIIIGAIIAATITKAATNIYLDRRD